ncbi:hypothetical protein BGX27_000205 [Mortierella sp. AM989]|nr:hypothetical protein BGX27_000205 [Mortierella sp. AM989]
MTVAIMFIGNAGAGKSTLLSQIGGGFESGVKFRSGYTKDIFEQRINIKGNEVVLMDVPGLFEPNEGQTKFNAKMLSDALRRGYDYKLFFVLKAGNRGTDNAEMMMMSKVADYARRMNDTSVSFRVIVNQIMDQEVYDMYRDHLQQDNCQRLFKSLKNDMGLSFDIKIDKVILLRFNTAYVEGQQFRDIIAEEVHQHSAFRLDIIKDLVVSNMDLEFFQKLLMALLAVVHAWTSDDEVTPFELLGIAVQAFMNNSDSTDKQPE